MPSEVNSQKKAVVFFVIPILLSLVFVSMLMFFLGYMLFVEPKNIAQNVATIEFNSEYVNRASDSELRTRTDKVIKAIHKKENNHGKTTLFENKTKVKQQDIEKNTSIVDTDKPKIIILDKTKNKTILKTSVDKKPKKPIIELANIEPISPKGPKEPYKMVSSFVDIIEEGPYGPLPKISNIGLTALTAYASKASVEALKLPPGSKKIAIVIGGLGLSKKITNMALEYFPENVTFAFAPYAKNLQQQVEKARNRGHEILLQVPMEPYGYPENDPGPHTLLEDLSKRDNLLRLYWLMSRFTDYIGITNYMGAKFVSDDESLEFFIRELRDRGLLYFDNGTAPTAKIKKTLNKLGVSYALSDVVLDLQQDEDSIAESLKLLQTMARQNGYAVGYASAFPMSVKQISRWVENLKYRGYEIVPLSVLVHKEKQYAKQ